LYNIVTKKAIPGLLDCTSIRFIWRNSLTIIPS
jgi:hypothetical protein